MQSVTFIDLFQQGCNFEILCANEWKESLSSHPKLIRTYCKFKIMLFAEPYILTNK